MGNYDRQVNHIIDIQDIKHTAIQHFQLYLLRYQKRQLAGQQYKATEPDKLFQDTITRVVGQCHS